MKEFFLRNKVFLIVTLITIFVIVGGVFLLSKPGSTSTPSATVSASILVPQGVYETSGLANGTYLPASATASVTLVEFGDYVCPACGNYSPYVQKILTDFPGKVNFVFRNYPLSYHTNAPLASYAAGAAGIQGKYWEMHEKLYSTQNDWSNLQDPTTKFVAYAKEMGLNTDQFTKDMGSQAVKDAVQRDTNDGNAVSLTETPTFYINGSKVTLSGDYSQLESLIQADLNK